MTDADNDNEPLPFKTLGALTERVLATHAKQDENREEDPEPGGADEQHDRERGAYVDCRLREIAEFERRANGKTPRRRPFR